MKSIASYLLATLLIFNLSGCKKSNEHTPEPEFDYIKYGTSFGFCGGYCIHDITISKSEINFHKSSWVSLSTYPDVFLKESIETHYWSALKNKIDFKSFTALDSIIGCPDCADGGAEWVEIKYNGIVHKVAFEYLNEPEALSGFIDYLRTYIDAFKTEPDNQVSFNSRTIIDQKGFIINRVSSLGVSQYITGIMHNNDTILYYITTNTFTMNFVITTPKYFFTEYYNMIPL